MKHLPGENGFVKKGDFFWRKRHRKVDCAVECTDSQARIPTDAVVALLHVHDPRDLED